MNPKHLIFRADGNNSIGTGHIMRCLSLAIANQTQGGVSTIISYSDDTELLNRVKDANINLIHPNSSYSKKRDIEFTVRYIQQLPNAVMITDGYHFDEEYQISLKETGNTLVSIEDYVGHNFYHSDFIINQNIDAENLQYPCQENTQLLLGTNYTILNPIFKSWGGFVPVTPKKATNILVTLGGSDFNNQTIKVINSLKTLTDHNFKTIVVVGSSNKNLTEIQKSLKHCAANIKLIINTKNMAQLIAESHLVLCAGGSTCWEVAFMGIPMINIIVAENQIMIANGIELKGGSRNLGWYKNVSEMTIAREIESLSTSYQERVGMTKVLQSMVDEQGTKRILEALQG